MGKLSSLLLSLFLFHGAVGAAEDTTQYQSYGAAMPQDRDAQTLRQAISTLEQGESREVKLIGKITEVCQAKGCWMILVDGDQYARITFKDYGFFVPTDTSMQQAVVYGQLEQINLSAETAAHYAEDAGREVESSEGLKEFSLVASAVLIEKS
ncbi:MAG: DUF4920 domain-containing protein [Pseudohongiellaceae bacterium]|nr:DUF4920 domain-containing protein [Pseudohongiellaceae bacterium]